MKAVLEITAAEGGNATQVELIINGAAPSTVWVDRDDAYGGRIVGDWIVRELRKRDESDELPKRDHP